jgi:hypothetical protein
MFWAYRRQPLPNRANVIRAQWASEEVHFKGSPCFTRILILFTALKS